MVAVVMGLGILFGSGLADRALHITGSVGSLSGHVVDYCSSAPLTGAGVFAKRIDGGSGVQTLAASVQSSGDYATGGQPGSPDGLFEIKVTKTGYDTVILEKFLDFDIINVQDFAMKTTGFTNCPPGSGPPGPDPPPPGPIGGNQTADPTTDFDGDLVPDKEDNCPVDPNPEQRDLDGDGIGDQCETGGSGRTLELVALLVLVIVILLGFVLIVVGLMR